MSRESDCCVCGIKFYYPPDLCTLCEDPICEDCYYNETDTCLVCLEKLKEMCVKKIQVSKVKKFRYYSD